ncbi:MAG: hypothetical protein AB1746_09045, partial [Candidatus Zixiibacteriota bacterium]
FETTKKCKKIKKNKKIEAMYLSGSSVISSDACRIHLNVEKWMWVLMQSDTLVQFHGDVSPGK